MADTPNEKEADTKRRYKREEEDQRYTPVIVKRVDESRRHPDDTLQNAICEGQEQLERKTYSLLLSSFAAGLILAMTALAVALATVAIGSTANPYERRLLTAFFYPLGFVLCIMSGTQLFTEHTATSFYPVLDRKAGFKRLLRLWLLVLAGNLAGAAAAAWLLALVEPVARAGDGYVQLAELMVSFGALQITASAVFAGWLMALGGWLVLSTSSTIAQILFLYLATFLIGVGGFHHSVAGTVELFAGALTGADLHLGRTLICIACMVGGNIIGGSLFVAALNYGSIRKTQEVKTI